MYTDTRWKGESILSYAVRNTAAPPTDMDRVGASQGSKFPALSSTAL